MQKKSVHVFLKNTYIIGHQRMSFIMLWVLNFFKIFLFDIFKPFFLLQVVDMINK